MNWLYQVEFGVNNTISEATNAVPFEVFKGRPNWTLVAHKTTLPPSLEPVRELTIEETMKLVAERREHLNQLVKTKRDKNADKMLKRSLPFTPTIQEGDSVLVRLENPTHKGSRKKRKKFDPPYSEPATVLKVNKKSHSYKVQYQDGSQETKSLKYLKLGTASTTNHTDNEFEVKRVPSVQEESMSGSLLSVLGQLPSSLEVLPTLSGPQSSQAEEPSLPGPPSVLGQLQCVPPHSGTVPGESPTLPITQDTILSNQEVSFWLLDEIMNSLTNR